MKTYDIKAMTNKEIAEMVDSKHQSLMNACHTNKKDADYYARGILVGLRAAGLISADDHEEILFNLCTF